MMRQAPQSQRGQRKQKGANEGRDTKAEWDLPQKASGWQEYKGQAPPTKGSADKQNQQRPKQSAEEEAKVSSDGKQAQAFEYKEHKTLSSLRLVTLSNSGVEVYQLKTNGPDQLETIEKEEGFADYPGAEIAKFSPYSGSRLAVVDFAGIHIIDINTKQEVQFMQRKGITALEWSIKDTYVISCEKFREGQNNLNVWDVESGKIVLECEWRNTAKDGPKSIKFDENERFTVRQIGKNIIEVFEGGDFS